MEIRWPSDKGKGMVSLAEIGDGEAFTWECHLYLKTTAGSGSVGATNLTTGAIKWLGLSTLVRRESAYAVVEPD